MEGKRAEHTAGEELAISVHRGVSAADFGPLPSATMVPHTRTAQGQGISIPDADPRCVMREGLRKGLHRRSCHRSDRAIARPRCFVQRVCVCVVPCLCAHSLACVCSLPCSPPLFVFARSSAGQRRSLASVRAAPCRRLPVPLPRRPRACRPGTCPKRWIERHPRSRWT